MSSEFTDSFTQTVDDSVPNPESTRPFDNDGYLGYDPRLSSQRYDFADSESLKDSATDSPIFHGSAGGDAYGANPVPDSPSSPLIYTDSNGKGFDGGFGGSDGPNLPPLTELEPEEGYALREWRRENAIRLEEKEKREKELLNQIIEEADEFKLEFYQKRKVAMESNKTANREKEKSFLDSQEKFHAEVSNNFWKAIAELIPNEVPTIEKRGKKEKEKTPSVTVIQGPKPGKPTDLSRMRQILVKLKHNTPPHLKLSPPSQPGDGAKNSGGGVAAPPKAAAVATPSKAVVAA